MDENNDDTSYSDNSDDSDDSDELYDNSNGSSIGKKRKKVQKNGLKKKFCKHVMNLIQLLLKYV